MTKISKKSAYPIKVPVVKDYFVGTDSANNLKTVNFGFEETAKLINSLNGLSTINYKFVTSENIPLDVLTGGNFLSSENETSFSSVTKLYINKFNHSDEDLYNLLSYLVPNSNDFQIKLQNASDLNAFVFFNIDSIENYSTHFIFNVKLFKSNPYLTRFVNWNIYLFTFDLKSGAVSGSGNEYLPNGLISLSEPSQTGNLITVAALNAVWRINKILITNGNAFPTTISPAANGFYRLDMILGNADGILTIVQGVENSTLAIKPDLPLGTVEILTIPVFGATVSTPTSSNLIVDITGKLDKGNYTGTGQTLKADIDAIAFPDIITKVGTVSEISGLITIPANGFEWRINKVNYVDVNGYTDTIDIASDGFYRTDIIVGNTSGGYTKIVGIPNTVIAVKPPVPQNTLEITSVSVYGSIITPPSTGTGSNKYITQSSKGFVRMFYTGVINAVTIDENSWLKFEQGMTGIKSINIPKSKDFYFGKNYIIKNGTSGNVTISHLQGTGGFRFNMPNSLDLVLKPEESVEFILRAINSTNNGGILDLLGISSSAVLQDLTIYEKISDNNAKLLQKANQSTTYTKLESDNLITQLLDGAPSDANTLKELNDKILAVQAIIGSGDADADVIVNTVKELLAVFATFPEGVDLVTLLAAKVDKTDVYNALDSIVAGKVLDARQGKVLNDLIASANAEIATKEPTITGGLVTTFFSGLKTFRNLATDVLAVVLGTYAKGAGTVASTDTIKGAIQKIDGNVDGKANKYGTRTVLSGTVIDWSTDTDTYTNTLTANTTLTDSNLPQGTDTKTIVLSIDGSFTLTVPAYWKLKGGAYSATKANQIVLQCVNGNAGSERVNYIINPDL